MGNNIKKKAILNPFQKTRRYFGIILPIIVVLVILSFMLIGGLFYVKGQELEDKKQHLSELKTKLKEYQGRKDTMLGYAEIKKAYNSYTDSLLNFDLIFRTLKHYIPKNAERAQMKIKKKKSNVDITVTAMIEGYDDYMSLLRAVDKCSYANDKAKKTLLNIQKVELTKDENDDEKIIDTTNINIAFNFDTIENQYLLQKKYEKKLKEFQNIGKFVYYINVAKDSTENPDRVRNDYFDTLKEFYKRKKGFSKTLAKILKTDDNGYFLVDSGENFINKLKTEDELLTLLNEKYYNLYKKDLEKFRSKIFDNGDIIFTDKKGNKTIVLNLKKRIDELLSEINTELLKIKIAQNYNNYLKQDNYLSTFENIKKSKEKRVLKIDGKEKQVSNSEYIINLIDEYGIFKEDDDLIDKIIIRQKSKENKKDGITEFIDKSDDEIAKERKKIYNQMIKFAQNIDKEKAKLTDVNTYLDNFYEKDLKYRLYPEGVTILTKFFSQPLLNTEFLSNIKYGFFDFRIPNTIKSYKKQFLLTIKNNKKLTKQIDKIKDLKSFVKELDDTEEFILKTDDVVLARNNNINCLIKDVKKETKTIYNSILKEKQDEDELKNKIKETDLIIDDLENGNAKKEENK